MWESNGTKKVAPPCAQRKGSIWESVIQWGDGGNVADGSKCKHSLSAGTKIASTRTAVGQLLSSRASSMGRWRTCQGRFKMQTRTVCGGQNHEQAHSSRSVQGSVQGGDGGHVWEGSKCKHSHTAVPKSRAHAQQSVSSRASSMGRWNVTCVGSIRQNSRRPATTHHQTVSIPVGRWNVTHGFDSRGTGGNVAEGSKGEHSAQKHILL